MTAHTPGYEIMRYKSAGGEAFLLARTNGEIVAAGYESEKAVREYARRKCYGPVKATGRDGGA